MKSKFFILIILTTLFTSCYESNQVKKIEIMYVGLYFDNIFQINCSDFDAVYKNEMKIATIRKASQIKQFINVLDNLEQAKLNEYSTPDSRIKIRLFYRDTEEDICMDNFVLIKNGELYEISDSLKKILTQSIGVDLWGAYK